MASDVVSFDGELLPGQEEKGKSLALDALSPDRSTPEAQRDNTFF